ncbi:hypothetical protein D3C80_1732910 [compost metagenome]
MCGEQGFLRLVDRGARSHLRLEKTLLAIECQLRLRHLRFGRLQVGHRNDDIRLLLFRVDASKQLPGLDPCTHIHQPLGDLAAHPKGKVRLDPCPYFTGDDAATADGLFRCRNHIDDTQRLFSRRLFVAAGRQGENAADRHC